MGIVKRITAYSKVCKSSRRPHVLKDIKSEGREDRFFTLKSLGVPKKIHLPVDVIERQKFSKRVKTRIRGSANEVLHKKREDFKKSLKSFINVAFPSSTNPYGYLMSNPGPVLGLEKLCKANQGLKPPKYNDYLDPSHNLHSCTLEFNDKIEISDPMPTKALAKLNVAHKALTKIRRRAKKEASKGKSPEARKVIAETKAKKELAKKMKFEKMMMEETKSKKVNQVNDKPPKDFYQNPRVRKLWANKRVEPKDDWFMENVSCRNFSLFKGFYPNTATNIEESESKTKKRKVIDWNDSRAFQEVVESRAIKRIQLEKENETIIDVIDGGAVKSNVSHDQNPMDLNLKTEIVTSITDNMPKNLVQEPQKTEKSVLFRIQEIFGRTSIAPEEDPLRKNNSDEKYVKIIKTAANEKRRIRTQSNELRFNSMLQLR
ncbi:11923_t:CDS:2 [Funneliformis geosporum]|uniref:12197_t:CDS:1 n=1 Tax=Funneliformis geosporum TaxID=1117311 RepID=A0A9W4WRN7_9GLOM|nr:11923_t:CDS:2 [Funneliformis geosporum]CAI2181286.1 12197_t:CDS:2 [Funneliformis geosporum]